MIAKKILCLGVTLVFLVAFFGNPINCGVKSENAKYNTPKDIFIFGAIGDVRSLDPARAYDTTSGLIIDNVYETLVKFKIENGEWKNEVVPSLATRWDISADGLTYTFYLRKGVKFTDGEDFNAQAVKYSFDRLIKMNQGPAQPVLGHVYESSRVIDDYTIEIKLKHPYKTFLTLLPHSCCSIVSPRAVEEQGGIVEGMPNRWMDTHMVGTGPFKLDHWTQGVEVELVRNDDYWGELPKLKKVIVKTIREPTDRYLMIQKGDIDLAEQLTMEQFDELIKSGQSDIEIVSAIELGIRHLVLNCEGEYTKDKPVRKAIAHAIDYKTFIEYIMLGYAKPGGGMVPEGAIGYCPEIKPYEYNVEKANKLLDEAGYKKGKDGMRDIEISYAFNEGNDIRERCGIMVQDMLKDIGISVSIRPLSWPTWLDALDGGNFNIGFLGWLADYPSGDNFLYPLCHSDNIGPGGNHPRYNNPEVDKLIEEIMSTTDEERMLECYEEAQRIIHGDVPYVPLYQGFDMRAVGSWVKGYVLPPLGSPDFSLIHKE
jgi:peptide/nickel transport system substrate-binding protein